jgi:group I intron endonuclease
MRKGVIYKISFQCSTKIYIGSAVNFKQRRWDHLKLLRRGKHPNVNLQRAFSKYSESHLEFSVLEQDVDETELIVREQHWIDQYDFKADLYNLCPVAGSSLGRVVSLETRQKMSNNRGKYYGEQNSFFGKTHTEESRELMAQKARGRKQSEETVSKRIATLKNNHGAHPNSKPVHQIDPRTDEIIKTWSNMSEAAKSVGTRVSSISTVCNKTAVFHKNKGKYYTTKTAGGYKWEFA